MGHGLLSKSHAILHVMSCTTHQVLGESLKGTTQGFTGCARHGLRVGITKSSRSAKISHRQDTTPRLH